MPLYRMLCITVHYPEYRHIKELITQSAMLLLDRGGVVRDISSLGRRTLPQRILWNKQSHVIGDYWTMQFDASPRLLQDLNRKMRTDPRVLRWTTLKLGERLEDVVEPGDKTLHSEPLVTAPGYQRSEVVQDAGAAPSFPESDVPPFPESDLSSAHLPSFDSQ